MRPHLISNHLVSGYSAFVFSSLKKISHLLNEQSIILDVGSGQGRHLKLAEYLGLRNLYGIDKLEPTNHEFYSFIKHDIEKGIPFPDQFADLTLANFLLMYISQRRRNFVISELMRVTRRFLIIETNKPRPGETYMNSYDFVEILDYIDKHPEFEIIQVRKSLEKILLKRRG